MTANRDSPRDAGRPSASPDDRPRCTVYIAVSLDGFIARRDGGLDWLSVVQRPGEDYGYARFFDSVDALILGRRTYDVVLGFPSWPYGNKPCVVMTKNPAAPRHGERFHPGAPRALLAQLATEGVRRAYVDGGMVIRAFLREGLIDDLTLSIIPTILGDGIRLFDEDAGCARKLHLTAHRAFESGLVQVTYEIVDSLGGDATPAESTEGKRAVPGAREDLRR
jgi:dihydrofolate reductase